MTLRRIAATCSTEQRISPVAAWINRHACSELVSILFARKHTPTNSTARTARASLSPPDPRPSAPTRI